MAARGAKYGDLYLYERKAKAAALCHGTIRLSAPKGEQQAFRGGSGTKVPFLGN